MTHTEKSYTCDALGNTYQIKDQLKKLGFRFNGDRKIWQAFGVTDSDKKVFQMQVRDRRWPGVTLKFHSPLEQTTPF